MVDQLVVWVLTDEGVCPDFCDDPNAILEPGDVLCTSGDGCRNCENPHRFDGPASVIAVYDSVDGARREVLAETGEEPFVVKEYEYGGSILSCWLYVRERQRGKATGRVDRFLIERYEVYCGAK